MNLDFLVQRDSRSGTTIFLHPVPIDIRTAARPQSASDRTQDTGKANRDCDVGNRFPTALNTSSESNLSPRECSPDVKRAGKLCENDLTTRKVCGHISRLERTRKCTSQQDGVQSSGNDSKCDAIVRRRVAPGRRRGGQFSPGRRHQRCKCQPDGAPPSRKDCLCDAILQRQTARRRRGDQYVRGRRGHRSDCQPDTARSKGTFSEENGWESSVTWR